MSWKKFKKNNVSLNYTVMLLPHSQKKPIHFRIPVWVFGLMFLFLILLVGGVLFFAGSSYQLRQVSREKQQLEQEWEQITLQKQRIEEENADLKLAREQQEEELEALEKKTSDTVMELEKLTAREKEIRSQLGMKTPEGEENGQTSDQSAEDAAGAGVPVGAAVLGESGGVDIVKKNLDMLTSVLEEQAVNYDDLTERIPEYKKEMRRKSIVDYALNFVGNRYVFGGNDPHTGVDCSGFSRYVLSHAGGVYLDRTAASQSHNGKTISIGEAQPGDLIFYGSSKYINHVAIYMGDGKVVHASNPGTGITISHYDYRQPVKVVNVLGD